MNEEKNIQSNFKREKKKHEIFSNPLESYWECDATRTHFYSTKMKAFHMENVASLSKYIWIIRCKAAFVTTTKK